MNCLKIFVILQNNIPYLGQSKMHDRFCFTLMNMSYATQSGHFARSTSLVSVNKNMQIKVMYHPCIIKCHEYLHIHRLLLLQLGNIHSIYRSSLNSIQLLCLVEAPVFDQYGHDKALELAIKDIRKLEQVHMYKDGSDLDSIDLIMTTPGFSFIPSASIAAGLQIKT